MHFCFKYSRYYLENQRLLLWEASITNTYYHWSFGELYLLRVPTIGFLDKKTDSKMSSRRLQDVFKTSSRRLQDFLKNVFKIPSRHLQEVLQRYLQYFFKTYHQVKLFLLTRLWEAFNTFLRRSFPKTVIYRGICLSNTSSDKFMVSVPNLQER